MEKKLEELIFAVGRAQGPQKFLQGKIHHIAIIDLSQSKLMAELSTEPAQQFEVF